MRRGKREGRPHARNIWSFVTEARHKREVMRSVGNDRMTDCSHCSHSRYSHAQHIAATQQQQQPPTMLFCQCHMWESNLKRGPRRKKEQGEEALCEDMQRVSSWPSGGVCRQRLLRTAHTTNEPTTPAEQHCLVCVRSREGFVSERGRALAVVRMADACCAVCDARELKLIDLFLLDFPTPACPLARLAI